MLSSPAKAVNVLAVIQKSPSRSSFQQHWDRTYSPLRATALGVRTWLFVGLIAYEPRKMEVDYENENAPHVTFVPPRPHESTELDNVLTTLMHDMHTPPFAQIRQQGHLSTISCGVLDPRHIIVRRFRHLACSQGTTVRVQG